MIQDKNDFIAVISNGITVRGYSNSCSLSQVEIEVKGDPTSYSC